LCIADKTSEQSVVRDPETQRSQGNGFVAFSDAEEAAAAEKALNGTE